MNKIDGPPDPAGGEKDAKSKAAARKAVCAAQMETRNCIQWLALDPVDLELKGLDVEVAKRRRTLTDAELRADKAELRANPKFNIDNIIKSIVGPFQIQQVVMNWIEYDRDVDREQVDRCQTCHMGADAGTYQSASIPKQFRTHPHRSTLFTSHPIEASAAPPVTRGRAARPTCSRTPAGTSRSTTAGALALRGRSLLGRPAAPHRPAHQGDHRRAQRLVRGQSRPRQVGDDHHRAPQPGRA